MEEGTFQNISALCKRKWRRPETHPRNQQRRKEQQGTSNIRPRRNTRIHCIAPRQRLPVWPHSQYWIRRVVWPLALDLDAVRFVTQDTGHAIGFQIFGGGSRGGRAGGIKVGGAFLKRDVALVGDVHIDNLETVGRVLGVELGP